ATESAPFALCTGALLSTTTHVGVPVPGLELKVAPIGNGVFEARLRGPNITPGYWNEPSTTSAAYDEEGFYRMGDALTPRDPSDLARGFLFAGRINEDFKLSTGTWVRVGAVRARLLAALEDLAQDVVIAGPGRDRATALIFPNVATCRRLADAGSDVPLAGVLAQAAVREAFISRLSAYNEDNLTSSTAVHRAVLLELPASLEAGEMTDKGSINQKAVLERRADLVARLYAGDSDSLLI